MLVLAIALATWCLGWWPLAAIDPCSTSKLIPRQAWAPASCAHYPSVKEQLEIACFSVHKHLKSQYLSWLRSCLEHRSRSWEESDLAWLKPGSVSCNQRGMIATQACSEFGHMWGWGWDWNREAYQSSHESIGISLHHVLMLAASPTSITTWFNISQHDTDWCFSRLWWL